jgi:excisionase family DNA binding protein
MKTTANTSIDALVDALADRIAARMEGKKGNGKTFRKRLLTIDEAAEYLGRTREAMQHLVSSGKMPTVRSDRRVFFDIHDLESWIERNKEQGLS